MREQNPTDQAPIGPFPSQQIWVAAVIILLSFGFCITWARYAELTTTIQVPGRLSANAISVQIQAPRTGQISDVRHPNFADVSAGDVLAVFDVKDLLAQAEELTRRIEQ